MTIEQLTTVLHTQPFQPFRIHMADGRSVDVAHPDFLSRSPDGRTVIVYKQDETFEIIDMLLAASIETLGLMAGLERVARKRRMRNPILDGELV